jgi:hypothetical protein
VQESDKYFQENTFLAWLLLLYQIARNMPVNKKPGFSKPGASSVCVPKEGFEPSRANAHYALNVARLPIPPLRREALL